MKTNFHVSTVDSLDENYSPISVAGDNYQTLLNAYNAILVDVPFEKLIFTIDAEQRIKPVCEGLKILYNVMLKGHQQIRVITATEKDGFYPVIEGEIQIEAMMDLGFESATVLVLNGVDELKATEIRKSLMSLTPDVPYSVVIPNFSDLKEAVKNARKEMKAEGKEVPTTNELLSETLGESIPYVKELDKISKQEDAIEIAERLDQGETIYAVTKGSKADKSKAPAPLNYEGKKIEVPVGFDLSAICSDCPRYCGFQDALQKRQSITKNATK